MWLSDCTLLQLIKISPFSIWFRLGMYLHTFILGCEETISQCSAWYFIDKLQESRAKFDHQGLKMQIEDLSIIVIDKKLIWVTEHYFGRVLSVG